MNKKVDPVLFLEPVDDGLVMRESGEWVLEKLHYIKRYIYMFTTSMSGKPWRNIRYIDLFSGPGKCKVRDKEQITLEWAEKRPLSHLHQITTIARRPRATSLSERTIALRWRNMVKMETTSRQNRAF